MKFKNLLLAPMLAFLIGSSASYADSFDNGPSADAVTGTSGSGAISDNWTNSGENEKASENSGIVPPPNSLNTPISRDGATMDDEDY